MKFFIDTADVKEIRMAYERGWVDGVTTNPSLIAKTGRPLREVIREICQIVDGPVSAEVLSTVAAEMVNEGRALADISPKVVVKIPLTEEGLIAVKKLSQLGIRTNVTLCFSPLQALLAAKAGATMVSPFVGRLDDIGHDGMGLIADILNIYAQYRFQTEVLVASVRTPTHVLEAARLGAHIATIPFKVLQQLVQHPLTDRGLEQFLKDAAQFKG
ncbi:MAG: fructose-6-phosphate aldolase [Bdellovibrionaceae bacterium]|nr:fructose-6-phosphate aldolase [Pseudobdellovibrionaceae bacterium]MDW8189471.1 fructose-6-phosphate aldolase [Pseudobdellovibrionaceae bacterium]